MSSTTDSDQKAKEVEELAKQQASKEAIIRSLRVLLEGDEQEQRETFEYLKQALDEDRPSSRKLFR